MEQKNGSRWKILQNHLVFHSLALFGDEKKTFSTAALPGVFSKPNNVRSLLLLIIRISMQTERKVL